MAEATLSIGITLPRNFMAGILGVVEGPFAGERGKGVVADIRASINSEFRSESFLRPSGGSTPWKARVPFPEERIGALLGGTGGTLASKWQGGPGGFETIEPGKVEVGIRDSYASVHRGGTGTDVNPSQVTTVRANTIGARGLPSMYWFLGMVKGVWISPQKLAREGLKIPARPHAAGNPKLNETIAKRIVAGLKAVQ